MSEPIDDSIALVRRAKAGDPSAWQALCDRYYDDWLGRLHAAGPRIARGCYETRDAVQSAIASALARVRDLRDDRTFFAWVGAIARRKMAQRRREERRGQPSRLAERARRIERAGVPEGDEADADGEGSGVSEAAYGRLLDAIIASFPTYPRQMTAVYLKYFERLEPDAMEEVLGLANRSVHRAVREGLKILKVKLG